MWGKTVNGRGMWNSREAPHERWGYGNCGIHVGRYLVHTRLDYVARLRKCISLA